MQSCWLLLVIFLCNVLWCLFNQRCAWGLESSLLFCSDGSFVLFWREHCFVITFWCMVISLDLMTQNRYIDPTFGSAEAHSYCYCQVKCFGRLSEVDCIVFVIYVLLWEESFTRRNDYTVWEVSVLSQLEFVRLEFVRVRICWNMHIHIFEHSY